MLTQLEPRTTVRDKGSPDRQAVLRDRIWTDIQRRHDALYHVGVAIWSRRKVDEHIRSLHAQAPQAAASFLDVSLPCRFSCQRDLGSPWFEGFPCDRLVSGKARIESSGSRCGHGRSW